MRNLVVLLENSEAAASGGWSDSNPYLPNQNPKHFLQEGFLSAEAGQASYLSTLNSHGTANLPHQPESKVKTVSFNQHMLFLI